MDIRSQLAPVLRDSLLSVVSSAAIPRYARMATLRRLGFDLDPKSFISPNCFFGATTGLTMRAGAFLNYGCFLDLAAPVTLEANVGVGYEVMFITAGHRVGRSGKRVGGDTALPIVVGEGAGVGARSIILPGVTIGRGTIIAAGSTVAHDCRPNSLYAGNPAAFVRDLAE